MSIQDAGHSSPTVTPLVLPAASRLTIIGALIVSVVILTIFGFAYGVCLYFKISDQISSFGQAAINMAMIAVGFWLGSSSGSEKKSDTIASIAAAPSVMTLPPRLLGETDAQYLARLQSMQPPHQTTT